MGKLHSLRKAILANPKIWYNEYWKRPIIPTRNRFGKWEPYGYYTYRDSYKNFVRKVLKEIGIPGE